MIEKVIVNLFVAIIEVICVKMLAKRFRIDKESYFKEVGIVFILLYLIFSVIATISIQNNLLVIIINSILLFGFTYMYRIKIIKRILAVIIFTLISISFEILTALLLGIVMQINIEDLFQPTKLYSYGAIISKFAIYITIKILVFIVKPKERISSIKQGLFNIMLPICSLIILIILSYVAYTIESNVLHVAILVVDILLILSNLGAFAVYEYSIKNKAQWEQQKRENLILQTKKAELSNLLEQQLRSNKEIHDIKHKLFSLRSCIESNNTKAISVLNELCENCKNKELICYTGIIDVDALLNVKNQQATSKQINIEYAILKDRDINISTIDLCIILGNILDNAIENSENQTEIKLSLTTKKGFVCIKSSNITKVLAINYGSSSKHDPYQMHGYGLLKIKEIAEFYDGNMECRIENNVFEIVIMLNNCILHPENG